jgi:hypothetical protein
MKTKIGSLVMFIVLLMAVVVNAQQPQITATLKAIPDSYAGKCPATIKFEGQITVKNLKEKSLKVQYKFMRSDGALSPIKTIVFDKDGSKSVSDTWTLGSPDLPTYSGWEAIKIVYPQDVESNKANFKLTCKIPIPPKPEITGYKEACGKKGGNITILGRNFGTQEGKEVALGGHGIHVDLKVVSWSDTTIVAQIPNDPRIQEGQWYYIGIKADSEWLSNISKNITICKTPELASIINVHIIECSGGTVGPARLVISWSYGTGVRPEKVIIDVQRGTEGSVLVPRGTLVEVRGTETRKEVTIFRLYDVPYTIIFKAVYPSGDEKTYTFVKRCGE